MMSASAGAAASGPSSSTDTEAAAEIREFLQTVITAPTGNFCLALGNGSNSWLEQWYQWPADLEKIVARALEHRSRANVYFSSYLFKAPQSTKENVLPSRTLQADLDNADVANDRLPLEPTVLVQTSEGRHQGYWILEETLPLEEHEAISRKLTYSIADCDRSGWPLGRKVRVPGTFNHKYLTGPQPVKVVRRAGKKHVPESFEPLPAVPDHITEHFDIDFIDNPEVEASKEHPRELLEKIKDTIPVKVFIEYDNRQQDRSAALWALMCWAFKAGLSRGQVYTLAKGSANNKFADLKHRANQDLAKDVLRAQHDINVGNRDPRQVIYDLYKTQPSAIDRKRQILAVVLKTLKDQGEFIHVHGGSCWYVRRDTGRPIYLSAASEYLTALLDTQFGLNGTEPDSRYVAWGLRSQALALPENGSHGALSFYDSADNSLLVHTGKRLVLRVTSTKIEHMVDGAYGVVFPWEPSVESFTPAVPREGPQLDWGDELFGNGTRGYGSSVMNVTNMTQKQAMALLKVWFMFVLFRNIAPARPIMATFGQPGAGKSTLFKKVYTLLYGRRKSLNAVTSPDDFDHAVAADPLVVLDNVDTWEKWLPDRLALSAGTSDIIRRKLYTDYDTIVLRRQAVVGVTAHNPRFGREDVADRFLLLGFRRLDKFVSEEDLYSDLIRKRDKLWGSILRDAQKILATPFPTREEVPQFRIEDFAQAGLWIARGIGVADDFRAAVEDVKSSQQSFSLEEDGLLVGAVNRYIDTLREKGEQPSVKTPAQLWSILEACAADQRAFSTAYRNSVTLSKKLTSMQVSLKKIARVEQSFNQSGAKLWLIGPKES